MNPYPIFLFNVPFSIVIWFTSSLTITMEYLHPQDIVQWFTQTLHSAIQHSQDITKLICPLAIIMYTIWFERNQVVFHNHEANPIQTLNLINMWQGHYIILKKNTSSHTRNNEFLYHCSHYRNLSIKGVQWLLSTSITYVL